MDGQALACSSCPCEMLEERSAKNTPVTPQQWFMSAFLKEWIPLISKAVKFILGACFVFGLGCELLRTAVQN